MKKGSGIAFLEVQGDTSNKSLVQKHLELYVDD